MIDYTDFQTDLIDRLKNGVVEITFTKKDGTTRVMPCTLQESVIPTSTSEKTSTKTKSADVCTVWALDVNDWRAFRWDSFQRFEVING